MSGFFVLFLAYTVCDHINHDEIMLKVKTENKIENSSLRIRLNGEWKTNDFVTFFMSLNKLYAFCYFITFLPKYYEGSERRNYRQNFRDQLLNALKGQKVAQTFNLDIRVKKINFSSPGIIDLLGVGKIFEILKEILFYYMPNNEKKEEIKKKQNENIKLLIKNLKAAGFTTNEVKEIILLREKNIMDLKIMMILKQIENIEIRKNN